MTQVEMANLLGLSPRTLQDWKDKKNRQPLFYLLSNIDLKSAKELVNQGDNEHIMRLLENKNYFTDYRAFEKELFNYLTSKKDAVILKKLSKNVDLSKEARARSAYLYSFLTKRLLKLSFVPKDKVGLYHENKNDYADGLARYYGLVSGIDMGRFNQYKMKGVN